MSNRISEITRRDIRDELSSLNLCGRLNELEFLARLYDLDELPSTDPRFGTARADIIQHRYNNLDWDDDWIFEDDRFGLKKGDEKLLRFLTEIIHPVVRSDQEEVTRITRALNELLAPDGYKLEVVDHISGRSVYGAVEIERMAQRFRRPTPHFTEDVEPLVATIKRLAEYDGSDLERQVLQTAIPRLEEPEYDNWNGGTYYYTLTLAVPIDVFAKIGNQVQAIEERIGERIKGVLRALDNREITSVVIEPSPFAEGPGEINDLIASRTSRPIPQFWAPDQFRLFISHISSFKARATTLRQFLSGYHVSGFVAHETIDPGELWQREIEAALSTMHALTALITPGFGDSAWTDQEVGWALGAGIYVLPVRRGADPYGFIGQVQSLQGRGKTVSEVGDAIFQVLLHTEATREPLLEALVSGFEKSDSYAEARRNIGLIERARSIPESLIQRVEVAVKSNDQISDSFGVRSRVENLIRSKRNAA